MSNDTDFRTAAPVPADAKPTRALSLRELDAVLGSDDHYQSTPTRNYGLNDPVDDAPKFICACPCGAGPGKLVLDFPDAAQLARQGGGPLVERKRRNFVVCKVCKRRGRSTAKDWSAVIEWNREHYTAAMPIAGFPFFNLTGLALPEAQQRVKAIRRDLELRKAQAKQQSAEGIETGRRYRERLEAYLGWAIAAASLLRVHAEAAASEAKAARPSS